MLGKVIKAVLEDLCPLHLKNITLFFEGRLAHLDFLLVDDVVLRFKLACLDGALGLLSLLPVNLKQSGPGLLLSDNLLRLEPLEGRAERLPLLLPVALQVLEEFGITLLDAKYAFLVSSVVLSRVRAQPQWLIEISFTLTIIVALIRHVNLHVLLVGRVLFDTPANPQMLHFRRSHRRRLLHRSDLQFSLFFDCSSWIGELIGEPVGTVALPTVHFW